METQTILLLIGAFILALAVALFQYFYKAKSKGKNVLVYTFLRFLSVFTLLVLLINPTFKQLTYFTEKPKLLIAVDNSSSIKHLKQDANSIAIVNKIKNNTALNDRFDIAFYSFAEAINDSLKISFDKKRTNISNVLNELDQIYKNSIAPIVTITDGNQTYGEDYGYKSLKYSQPVYPVILGDTTVVEDTKIQQINVNRYAYLKNKFPVEIILTYTGSDPISTTLAIKSGKSTVHSEKISFSNKQNSQILNITLPAATVGVNKYEVTLEPMKNELHRQNNKNTFAVEVIDQKTNVLLVSAITHPDIGAIKKSIESNERRSLTIAKPNEIKDLKEYQLVILYQPTQNFKTIYTKLKSAKKNYFTITGSHTNWSFLNQIQNKYHQELTNQTEYYIPKLNSNYSTYLLDDLGFQDYPPLIGAFGDITMKSNHATLLYRTVNNIDTEQVLLATIEQDGIREGVLFGQDIWKWRSHNFVETKKFESFDEFFGKLIQYLTTSKNKSRLNVSSESFYYGNASIIIKASYFNKNYEFDRRGELKIQVTNKKTKASKSIPMLLKNNSYDVDLSSLDTGDYEFTVAVANENLTRSGSFSILEYNVEQQFLNADASKLKQVALNTKGKAYYLNETDTLVNDLLKDSRFQTIQKSKEKIISLVDWKYVLGFLLLLLSIEWFLRKYHGLI